MRAEERQTRSILDVEAQDAQQACEAMHEAEEASRMRLEEVAMRELQRSERDREIEQSGMEIEDGLSSEREDRDR